MFVSPSVLWNKYLDDLFEDVFPHHPRVAVELTLAYTCLLYGARRVSNYGLNLDAVLAKHRILLQK